MKVALDTNVLVSAVATRGLCADIFKLVLAQHQLIVGETVLRELQRVLQEKLRVPHKVSRELDALLRREAVVVAEVSPLSIAIRDETDVPVLAEAVAGGAEVLVTGDRDLLEIEEGELPIRILSPRGLWELVREDTPHGQ